MYDELVKRLRICAKKDANCVICGKMVEGGDCFDKIKTEAADAIEELTAKVESLQFFADNISKLPDCNTCFKNTTCEFLPKYGDYCRINCPVWLGEPEPQKEEK